MSELDETRQIVLRFPVTLTPTFRRISRLALDQTLEEMGLAAARAVLVYEVHRIERMATHNEIAGQPVAAAKKRRKAEALRQSAALLAEVYRQIDECQR